jgi:acetyl esterase/lipase
LGIPVNRAIGRCLAQNGIMAVLPSYRLSPGVRHPGHVEDVARAFAWTYKHARKHGGRADRLFVAGHSAGAHLVSLLATDDTYLKAVGRSRQDIRGVVALSGVYRLDGFRVRRVFGDPWRALEIGLDVNTLAPVFGPDPKGLKEAAPLTHVQPGLPPFLLVYAGFDLWTLPANAKEFAAALKANRCQAQVKEIPWRTHETVLYNPFYGTDPVTLRAVLHFVVEKSKELPAKGSR